MTVPCSKKEREGERGLPLLSSSLPVKGIVRDRERDSDSQNQNEGKLSAATEVGGYHPVCSTALVLTCTSQAARSVGISPYRATFSKDSEVARA